MLSVKIYFPEFRRTTSRLNPYKLWNCSFVLSTLGMSAPYFIHSIREITWCICFIYLPLDQGRYTLTLTSTKLAILTSLALCVCVLVIQRPGEFYVMFSNFYSFTARMVWLFHKFWRKKAVTLIFESTSS